MLFSEEWLRSYINPDLTTDELAEKLTMAGLEVEEVTSIAPEFSGVVVGHVLECVDHENSDHLHVCKVDVGEGEVLQSSVVRPTCVRDLRWPAPRSAPYCRNSRSSAPRCAVWKASACSARSVSWA